jgi:hypothetical protein
VLVVTTPNPYGSASAVPGLPTASVEPSPPPSSVPSPSAARGVRVWRLLDPAGLLRASIPGLPPLTPLPPKNGTILLVSSDWAVVRVVSTTVPVNDLKPDLANLAG